MCYSLIYTKGKIDSEKKNFKWTKAFLFATQQMFVNTDTDSFFSLLPTIKQMSKIFCLSCAVSIFRIITKCFLQYSKGNRFYADIYLKIQKIMSDLSQLLIHWNEMNE